MNVGIPTFLTLFRLVFSFIFPFILYYVLPFGIDWLNTSLAIIFFLVSLTDFFDGFLARWWKQETFLGKELDPIADKIFFIGPCIALVAMEKLYFYWAFIFISRELIISGLRSSALRYGLTVSVSWLGKIKTVFQYSYLTLIIGAPWNFPFCMFFQELSLILALSLSVFSGFQYIQMFLLDMKERSF